MKLHRFIIQGDFSKTPFCISDKELAHQMKDVLQLKIGEECLLSDGNRNEARCRIKAFSAKGCIVEILSQSYNVNENNVRGILYCSLLKKEHFETVVQKAAEVGISEIVPIISRRTVKLAISSRARLEKILKEASEQSGRGIIPALCDASSFDNAIQRASASHAVTFFYHTEGVSFADWKKENIAAKKANIFIGPEGGWDAYELEAARKNHFFIVSLGPTVLRAETAAIIGSYVAMH